MFREGVLRKISDFILQPENSLIAHCWNAKDHRGSSPLKVNRRSDYFCFSLASKNFNKGDTCLSNQTSLVYELKYSVWYREIFIDPDPMPQKS